MKKFLILLFVITLLMPKVFAKDYAKMHLKHMKKNQEYRINNTYYDNKVSQEESIDFEIKDPKLLKFGDYKDIPANKLEAKYKKDEQEYAKISKYLVSKKVNEYHMQAYAKDFYRVYRITEKLIRANGLDFINWRVAVSSNNEFNAYNEETNSITINAGAIDTFVDNEDALAFVIAHELAHGLLGHSKRKSKHIANVARAKRIFSHELYRIALKRYYKLCRDMEYEADVEGAKLVAKAGYDLSNAKETIAYINTLRTGDELNQPHPNPEKRLKNYEQNKKYFVESEWKKQGLYNIYNSKVLNCEKSSNRNYIVIERGKRKNENAFYKGESVADLYLRYGYKSYLNGEFKKAIKYFNKYLGINKDNKTVYLYLSFAYEYLYKSTQKDSYLETSKMYADMMGKDYL